MPLVDHLVEVKNFAEQENCGEMRVGNNEQGKNSFRVG